MQHFRKRIAGPYCFRSEGLRVVHICFMPQTS
ncbi:hypothetical protein [Porphyromonas gingivalis]